MWRFLLALAALQLGAGCELEQGECDPTTDPNCVVPSGDGSTDSDGLPPKFAPYVYVLVQDLEERDRGGGRAGADIVAVELRSGGASSYASQVHDCEFGGLDNSLAQNCNVVQGVPLPDEQSCLSDPTPAQVDFVSLGGVGGSMVVSFGLLKEIQQGDQLVVYACDGVVSEHYNALVGTSSDPNDPNWRPCISNGTGISSCTVPVLPGVPVN